ncbi:MAG: heavy metal translocating P-type ATPase [Bacilli bacterium]
MRKKYNVEGMTCAACQGHVNKAVTSLNGIKECNVNLLQNTMVVDYDENILSSKQIEEAVKKAGYSACEKEKIKVETKKDNDLISLIIAIILLLVLMYFSMGNMMWGWIVPPVFDHHQNPMGFALIQFILVLPIVYIYRKYFINGFKRLFKGKPNMDSLIAIGSSFSLAYGIFALFMISLGYYSYHDSLYFESAGMILTLVSLGKYLEKLSKKKTTSALTRLMDLAPKKARKEVDGKEEEIDISEVRSGDILIVKNGDKVPVDGIIIYGKASLDQSNITGESLPVLKKEGEEVFASTIVSSGYIKVKASKVGEDSSFATIIKLVEEASSSKAPISRLADRVSAIFVPLILTIAILTFILNMIFSNNFELSFNFAITVVVIACPCALGLATPVAIMCGTGKGAENGLLIKNAEILEKAHSIKTVVMDKTGTITKGTPEVTDFISLQENKEALDIIYSLENKSEHPLAKCLIAYCKKNNAKEKELMNYHFDEGKGLYGDDDTSSYYIGNSKGIEVADNIKQKIDDLQKEGKTVLIFAKDEEVQALIGIKDEVKETTKEAIEELQKRGIDVIMLTGDNYSSAACIAKEVGIKKVIADVYPQDKLEVITSLKKESKGLVAMIGDGVNDAPSLMGADLGIALGSGAEATLESSDIVLLRNDLLDVVNVILLSKRTLRTIKIGLFWAFFYNSLCVILASGIFYYINDKFVINPMIGSLAMSLSSVSVVLNALTINLFKIKRNKKEKVVEKEENKKMEKVIKVEGMMCMHCKARVEKEIQKVENVVSVEANLATKEVSISYEGSLDLDEVKKVVTEAGYQVL